MNQDEIATMFRGGEMARRQERRERLRQEYTSVIKRMTNEGMLVDEKLDAQAQAAHDTAAEQMRRQDLAFEKEFKPGYWERLWAALWGR